MKLLKQYIIATNVVAIGIYNLISKISKYLEYSRQFI